MTTLLHVDSSEALLAALCSSAAAAEGGTVAQGLLLNPLHSPTGGRAHRSSVVNGVHGMANFLDHSVNLHHAHHAAAGARSAAAAADLTGLLLDTLTEMMSRVVGGCT